MIELPGLLEASFQICFKKVSLVQSVLNSLDVTV